MVNSASFHGVVGLQNGSQFQINRKNYWWYDGFITAPETGDICVNVFMFGANTASAEDSIYLMDAWTTISPIIDDEGKSAQSLHLFVNDDLQPLPDGARTFPTIIIAGPSDVVTATNETSETVPPVTLKQFDWGGVCKEKDKRKEKGKAKDQENDEMDNEPSASSAMSHKVAQVSK
ncbi:hypothetical protein BDR04DRAFT_1122371 [Suillus decipiens]|nr:hypothetical protein BDR04DRAFT_1122371 [Suillus decipiens]